MTTPNFERKNEDVYPFSVRRTGSGGRRRFVSLIGRSLYSMLRPKTTDFQSTSPPGRAFTENPGGCSRSGRKCPSLERARISKRDRRVEDRTETAECRLVYTRNRPRLRKKKKDKRRSKRNDRHVVRRVLDLTDLRVPSRLPGPSPNCTRARARGTTSAANIRSRVT